MKRRVCANVLDSSHIRTFLAHRIRISEILSYPGAQVIRHHVNLNTIPWCLVSRFPVKHTGTYRHAIKRCAYGSCYATIVKIRHDLATLNSNNSVVYGQKPKVWVLVFLVRTSGTFRDQN